MTLMIEMPTLVEQRLRERAAAAGVDLQTYAQRILEAEAIAPSLDDALKPARDAFAKSGMTEEQLADEYEAEKHTHRAVKRGIKFSE